MALNRNLSKILLLTCLTAVLNWGCSRPSGIHHTIREGQTLYRIARTYEVNEKYLARLNGISDPTRLEVGQRLFVPGASRLKEVPSTVKSPEKGAKATAASPGKVAAVPRQVRAAPKAHQSKGQKVPPRQAPPKTVPKAAVATQKGKFSWPLRGKILRSFDKGTTEISKGLEIGTPLSTPVLSSAAGQVIYSGNGIAGFGNLIILEHDESFYTVYGFNQKNLVETGKFVSQGERIALSGLPPRGGTPRLHFEIRRGKKAVNPIFFLP
ncbi:MAG: hypothetical protein C0617_15440 [Desulfuromonas sp.]|nr:MAG: hypothetical protein C0617_15440 [Desulfuromonas sp.]